jgi:hypothetical protein
VNDVERLLFLFARVRWKMVMSEYRQKKIYWPCEQIRITIGEQSETSISIVHRKPASIPFSNLSRQRSAFFKVKRQQLQLFYANWFLEVSNTRDISLSINYENNLPLSNHSNQISEARPTSPSIVSLTSEQVSKS